jgi:hypothetical protein
VPHTNIVADGSVEEVLLIEGIEQRLTDLRVVERLLQTVRAEGVLVAERVVVDEMDVRVLGEQRQQVVRRRFDVIDLAGEQRVDDLLLIGHRQPLDPVDLGGLAAGETGRRLGARLVFVEFDVDRLVARLPFVLFEHERTGTGEIGNLRVRVGVGDALGHHERHVRGRLAERKDQKAGRLLELDGEGVGALRAH